MAAANQYRKNQMYEIIADRYKESVLDYIEKNPRMGRATVRGATIAKVTNAIKYYITNNIPALIKNEVQNTGNSSRNANSNFSIRINGYPELYVYLMLKFGDLVHDTSREIISDILNLPKVYLKSKNGAKQQKNWT